MLENWRLYRPALWIAMLGVALILVVNPPYIGGVALGAGIGIALKVHHGLRGRRRASRPPASRR